jgi:hypothetical protein
MHMRALPVVAVSLLFAGCIPPADEPGSDDGSDDGSDEGSGGGDDDGSAGEDDSTGAVPSECPAPTAGPTMVGEVTSDETWSADGSPYIFEYGSSIRAQLTLEPCTEVLIGPDLQITVRDGGSIVALGTETMPVRIGALDPTQPFASIRLYHGGPLDFTHTIIEGGGATGTVGDLAPGMIDVQAVDAPSPYALDFDHVTVRRSAAHGIRLYDGARFAPTSTALTVTENDGYPVHMWAAGLSSLPDGDYTQNAVDAVFLVGGGAAQIAEDTTMHDRGVPYIVGSSQVGTQLRVIAPEGAPPALLTIEPGVELRFARDGVLHVDHGSSATDPARGGLVAVGTPEAPIVFTSVADDPAAGDWLGLYFWNLPDPRNAIAHARVEYAGGSSQIGSSACAWGDVLTHDAAIRFLGTADYVEEDEPSPDVVQNTTITASAADGIDRGWVGPPVDLSAGNTFEDIAHCWQSYPRPDGGTCPESPPCQQ